MYRLMTIDLDGTLLNSYSEVSRENEKALQIAINKGIDVVLASGRISSSILNIAKKIGADHYFISGNGACVYDMEKQQVLYENYIEKRKLLQLIKLCDENSIYYNIYTEDYVIAKSIQYNVLFYHYENSKKSVDKKTNINIVEDVYHYIEQLENARFLKVTICDSNKIVFSSIVRKLKKLDGLDVLDVSHMSRKIIKSGTEEVEVGYYYTEITKKNVDKWNAIEKLMQIKGIDKQQVIAIGDNMNDKMMIEHAGLGIAMGHSHPAVKQVADFVTDDNNADGVAKAIYQFLG